MDKIFEPIEKYFKRYSRIFINTKTLNLVFLIISLTTKPVMASITSGSFLRLQPNARIAAISQTFAGVSDNSSGLISNPAGLIQIKKPECSSSFFQMFLDTTYQSADFAIPIKEKISLGFGFASLLSKGFEKRENPWDTAENFDILNQAIFIGSALKLRKNLSIGISACIINKRIFRETANGITFNLGLLHKPEKFLYNSKSKYIPSIKSQVGIVVKNLNQPKVKFIENPFELKRGIIFSPVLNLLWKNQRLSILSSLEKYESKKIDFAVGLEYNYKNFLALRGGLRDGNFSTGAGLVYGNLSFDYALIFHEISESHRFSIGLKFGKTKEEIEDEIQRGLKKLEARRAKSLAKTCYEQAINFAKEKNYFQAVSYLEKATLLDPDNKDITEKLSLFKKELDIQLNSQIIERIYFQALDQYRQNNLLVALEYFKTILEMDPENKNAQEYTHKITSRLGEAQKIEIEKREKEKIREKVSSLLTRGRDFLAKGKFKEAISSFKEVLKIDRENSQAITGIQDAKKGLSEKIKSIFSEGVNEYNKNNYLSAAEKFQKCLEMDPTNKEAQEYLRKCRELAKKIITPEQKKEIEKLYYQAVEFYLKEDYEKSDNILQKIFKIDPSHSASIKLKEKIQLATAFIK